MDKRYQKKKQDWLKRNTTEGNPDPDMTEQTSSPMTFVSKSEFDSRFEALQTTLTEQFQRVEAAMGRMNTHQETQPKVHHLDIHTQQTGNPLALKFIKDPMSFHSNINTKRPVLAFDGSNFNIWEGAVDRTLRQAFDSDPSFLGSVDNFAKLSAVENRAIVNPLRNLVDDELYAIIEASQMESSKAIYDTLVETCKRSDRQHKLAVVEKMMNLLTSPEADMAWITSFHTIMADLNRLDISRNELVGLLVQSVAVAPPGIDSKTYDYSVSQQLNDAKSIPQFLDVANVLQGAIGKLRPKTTGGLDMMELDRIQAIKQCYVPPQRRAFAGNPAAKPHLSVNRAAYYAGKNKADALLDAYGCTCQYCGGEGHWYADCNIFWADVRMGKNTIAPT